MISEHNRTIIYFSMLPCSTISFIGCSVIIMMYLKFTNLQTLPFKLITILSLFDLINAAAFLIPTYNSQNNDLNCQVQASLVTFSSLAGLVWTTFMAVFLYQAIKNINPLKSKSAYVMLGFVLVVSVCASIIPFFSVDGGAYGKTMGWCWIKNSHMPLRVVLFFGPLLLIIPLNFFIYIQVKRKLDQLFAGDQSNLKFTKKIKNKLMLYPIIIIICYLPYSIKAILEFGNVDIDEFKFTLISGILRNLHGFLNFLIYGLTTTVQKKFRKIFKLKSDESFVSLKKVII